MSGIEERILVQLVCRRFATLQEYKRPSIQIPAGRGQKGGADGLSSSGNKQSDCWRSTCRSGSNPLAGLGGAPGGSRYPLSYSHQHEIQACKFRKSWFHYNAMSVRPGVHFFRFSYGFKRPETQPQTIKSIILKIKIRDLVRFGADTTPLALLLQRSYLAMRNVGATQRYQRQISWLRGQIWFRMSKFSHLLVLKHCFYVFCCICAPGGEAKMPRLRVGAAYEEN